MAQSLPKANQPLCGHPLLCWAVAGLPGSRTHLLTWPLQCRVLAAGLRHTRSVLVGKGLGGRRMGITPGGGQGQPPCALPRELGRLVLLPEIPPLSKKRTQGEKKESYEHGRKEFVEQDVLGLQHQRALLKHLQ